MKKKNIVKKFLFIILCVVLSLTFLKLSLKCIDFTISYYKQYKNNKELKKKSKYTIICLGESSTFLQYPVQLQKILNKRYPNKFLVIDCGQKALWALTEENLNKYKPDIAICMGCNIDFINLFSLAIKYIKKDNNQIDDLSIFFTDEKKELLLLAVKLHNKKEYKSSIELLTKLLELTEKDSDLYQIIYTMLIFNYNMIDGKISYEMSLNAIINNYFLKDFYYFNCFVDLLSNNKSTDPIFLFLINSLFKEKDYVLNIDLYNKIEPYLTDYEKQILLNKILSQKGNEHIIALQYLKQKDFKKADKYFNDAEKTRLKTPLKALDTLYKLMLKRLTDKNIKVICMQFPMRSIKPLKEMLKNEPYYNQISFISNEKLFKKALMKKDYKEIFRDQWAGDFGNCTDLGNTMIAENVANTLENILALK